MISSCSTIFSGSGPTPRRRARRHRTRRGERLVHPRQERRELRAGAGGRASGGRSPSAAPAASTPSRSPCARWACARGQGAHHAAQRLRHHAGHRARGRGARCSSTWTSAGCSISPAAKSGWPPATSGPSCRCTSTGTRSTCPALAALQARFGLALVEDCAQSVLARFGGRRAGTVGAIAATSFYPTKNLGALGDGGALVTDDRGAARPLRLPAQLRSDRPLPARRAGPQQPARRAARRHPRAGVPAAPAPPGPSAAARSRSATSRASATRACAWSPPAPGADPCWHLFPVFVPAARARRLPAPPAGRRRPDRHPLSDAHRGAARARGRAARGARPPGQCAASLARGGVAAHPSLPPRRRA